MSTTSTLPDPAKAFPGLLVCSFKLVIIGIDRRGQGIRETLICVLLNVGQLISNFVTQLRTQV